MPSGPTELGPAFEHATVADAMRSGVVSCPAGTGVRAAAAMMASYRVHAILVEDMGSSAEAPSWGILSDMDVARAAAEGRLDASAGELARHSIVSVQPGEPLSRVAELMSEHGTSHVVVAEGPEAHPSGVVSTIDLAAVIAWGRA